MVEAKSRYFADYDYDIVRGQEIRAHFDYSHSNRLVRSVASRLDTRLVGPLVNAAATRRYLDHDLFIFIYRPWLPEALLLPLLKRLGKRVIFYFLGSDVRHFSAFSQEFGIHIPGLPREFILDPLDPKARRLRHVEKWADLVYSVPDQSGLQIRPYYHTHLPLDVLGSLTPRFPGRKVPVVVHAPTRRELKGTGLVLRAVEELKRAGVQLELRLLSGVPRPEVLAALADADIVVDQLFLHGPGMLSVEAMASGCAVATRTLEPPSKVFTAPVCAVTGEDLIPRLRRLVEDVPYRLELAHAGREWALREHDPSHVVERIEQHLAGGIEPDYTPTFFLEKYHLPLGAHLTHRTRQLGWEVLQRHRPDAVPLVEDACRRGLIEAPAL